MRRLLAVFYCVLAILSAASLLVAADEPPEYPKAGFGFLEKHCLQCHSGEKPKAGLSLHGYRDEASLPPKRKVIESVLAMVEEGEMPPKERPRPTADELIAFAKSVRGVFERADKNARPDPGRVTMRRLNKTEYRNTIRDLIGVDFNPTEDFPSDDVGHGFDNIGDVLTLSPVLMERYLAAAENILNRAILPNPPAPPKRQQSGIYLEPAGGNVPQGKFRPISTEPNSSPVFTGPLHNPYQWEPEGEYIFRTKLYATTEGTEPVRVAVLVNGKDLPGSASDEDVAKLSGVAAPGLKPLVILKTFEIKARAEKEAEAIEVKVPAMPGRYRMALAIYKPAEGQPPVKLHVPYFELEGPLDTRPSSHRRLLACSPDKPKLEQTREIVTRFVTRAYRRTATADEVHRLVKLVEAAEASGDKWETGVQLALQAVLVSPKFLFRVELDDRPQSLEIRPLDEFQLAARLSYFLWSSLPDDELLGLAEKTQLTANLDAQVRRMLLKDPKAKALVENFALQWLQLQRIMTFAPDAELFPTYNDALRAAMLEETKLFFETIVRENRSVLELIDADFTFLNEPLARHYGIVDTNGNRAGQKPTKPGGQPIRGPAFVRVSLSDNERGGILTHASVLTVTSNPTRTSPVKRGRWVLEQILGTPPPPPPPNVPELVETEQAALTGSLRQRMEQHRSNPSCANCHAKMDPLGFAFENFNAIGAFRAKDGEFPVDASGVLPGGQTFQGPAELKSILKGKQEQIVRCLTERLLIYALGRGLEYFDKPTIDRIVAAAAKDDFRFATLVIEIVKSEPFRLRRGL